MTFSTLPRAVAKVAFALRELSVPWAIAGGWAVDLALGRRVDLATDDHDFEMAMTLMDAEARAWPGSAIARRAPEHPWLTALAPEA